jgi:nucleoside-diphosphate-sugar epimerase
MKLFVAGGTGVLGRRAVPRLLEAGHEVTGIARSDTAAEQLRDAGATPARVDLFEAPAITEAVRGHDAVLNLATSIPSASKAFRPGAWAMNDRIRTEGAHNLVDAALAAGATRYVQESIAFIYPDGGDDWIDESTPLASPKYARSTLDAEAQAARFTDAGRVGVVLRFGMFYGAGSAHTEDFVRLARRRVAANLGAREGYLSSVHLDDAAAAGLAALGAPAGVYNVVDDEPLRRGDYFDALADAFELPHTKLGLSAIGKLGGEKAATLTRSQRVSNARFKQATGWAPRYPSAREGWVQVAAETAGAMEQR